MDYNISFYLDQRTKKLNGEHAIRLRVYSTLIKKQKFYNLNLSATKKDFGKITDHDVKNRGRLRELHLILQEIENRADHIAKGLGTFTFDAFETKMFRPKGASVSVGYHYSKKIDRLESGGQVATAENYRLSLKSLGNYAMEKKNINSSKLSFYDITPEFLKGYENYMVKELDRSRTTVSIYLRALRSVYNDAIASDNIKREIYPFGKSDRKKYTIPNPRGRKLALSAKDFILLRDGRPLTPEQEKAKAFWFFSYACSGMNIKDIALLRIGDVSSDSFSYYRAKTINTRAEDLNTIKVFLTDFTRRVIKNYGNLDGNPKDFVFPILDGSEDPGGQQRKIKAFTRFINQHITKLAQSLGIGTRISTYTARHTFATNARNKGASTEFIKDALDHSNIKTTEAYLASFDDEVKREFSRNIMEV
ncbi:site-specific integrase [Ulvibacterium sp.]|uniref:tyrosine-type recombinase/integrase n=1 Tax=Ulvibacterium sp. TaxID=2665914 RepID=UPI00260DC5CE|nr:site-specific integrase [Ulvibacterium sp.]